MGSWAHDRLVELIEEYEESRDARKFQDATYRTLRKRFHDLFFHTWRGSIPDEYEREGAVQYALVETTQKLQKRIEDGEDTYSPLEWCRRSIKSRIIDEYRRLRRRTELAPPLPQPPDAEGESRDPIAQLTDPRAQGEEHELSEVILTSHPDEKCRRLFRMMLDGYKQKEIAAALGVTEQRVSAKKRSCLDFAKKLVEKT